MGLSFARLSALVLLLSLTGWSAEPLRDLKELGQEYRTTQVARVVLADYDLLRRDFPRLRGLSQPQIDEWLLSTSGKMALGQVRQDRVNTPIQTVGQQQEAIRPANYGRGFVFEAKDAGGAPVGFLDGKGFGSETPTRMHHSSGLMTLGEAIREFLYEKMVKGAFDHSQSGFDTVGHYAVIDWGFDEIHPNGKRSPAGAVLRQAHGRHFNAAGSNSFLDDLRARETELVLRRYGLTATGDSYNVRKPAEMGLNVQGTPRGELVDFGHFLSVDEFHGVASGYEGRNPLLLPEDPD